MRDHAGRLQVERQEGPAMPIEDGSTALGQAGARPDLSEQIGQVPERFVTREPHRSFLRELYSAANARGFAAAPACVARMSQATTIRPASAAAAANSKNSTQPMRSPSQPPSDPTTAPTAPASTPT